MTHWMRNVGVAGLSLVGVFGAASAFAADPPAHKVHVAHVKAPAPPITKTAPAQGSPGSHVMLNPQPIPPGKSTTGPVVANGGSKVMLNTQPIPPGKSTGPVNASGGSNVMLNTQPIPPGKATSPTTTNGGDKAIIFVGGKNAKPKAKTGSPAIPPGPPGKQKSG